MDLNQATQMLTWLDEERRQDKTELARLQEQVRSQAAEIAEQARRIQELEGRLAGTQVHLSKIDRLDDFLQQFKDEIVLLVEKYDQQRRQAEKEARHLRQMDRENQSKVLAGIKKELPKLGRLEEELQLRRAEDKRLGEAVLNIQQELADVASLSTKPFEPPPEPQTAAATEPAEITDTKSSGDIEYLRSRWKDFISAMRGEGSRGNLDAVLRSACEPLAVKDGTLTVGFYHQFHKEYIEDRKYKHLVEKKLQEVFGQPYKLDCVIIERTEETKAEIPLVKAAQEIMGAKIIDDKPETEEK